MIAEYFCKGLLIGLIFGVPAGAIGALTIGQADHVSGYWKNTGILFSA
ncbi:MAG: hypothetical protein K2I22_16940 [Lachnospiraceae bacterium]|nr:hypothetical protein [Lachnospiraceae bacterium]